jgi:hypothetical protein
VTLDHDLDMARLAAARMLCRFSVALLPVVMLAAWIAGNRSGWRG